MILLQLKKKFFFKGRRQVSITISGTGERVWAVLTRQQTWQEGGQDFQVEIHSLVIAVQLLSCVPLCNPMDYRMLGFFVLHYLLEFAQIHAQESTMPSNHLILCHALLLLLVFLSIRVFSNDSSQQVTKYQSVSFSISPFNEYAELISFRID